MTAPMKAEFAVGDFMVKETDPGYFQIYRCEAVVDGRALMKNIDPGTVYKDKGYAQKIADQIYERSAKA